MLIRIPLLLTPFLLAACAGNPEMPPPTPCQGYCSTHADGYQWAQSGNFTDPRYCRGYVETFVEGCVNGIRDRIQYTPASQGI